MTNPVQISMTTPADGLVATATAARTATSGANGDAADFGTLLAAQSSGRAGEAAAAEANSAPAAANGTPNVTTGKTSAAALVRQAGQAAKVHGASEREAKTQGAAEPPAEVQSTEENVAEAGAELTEEAAAGLAQSAGAVADGGSTALVDAGARSGSAGHGSAVRERGARGKKNGETDSTAVPSAVPVVQPSLVAASLPADTGANDAVMAEAGAGAAGVTAQSLLTQGASEVAPEAADGGQAAFRQGWSLAGVPGAALGSAATAEQRAQSEMAAVVAAAGITMPGSLGARASNREAVSGGTTLPVSAKAQAAGAAQSSTAPAPGSLAASTMAQVAAAMGQNGGSRSVAVPAAAKGITSAAAVQAPAAESPAMGADASASAALNANGATTAAAPGAPVSAMPAAAGTAASIAVVAADDGEDSASAGAALAVPHGARATVRGRASEGAAATVKRGIKANAAESNGAPAAGDRRAESGVEETTANAGAQNGATASAPAGERAPAAAILTTTVTAAPNPASAAAGTTGMQLARMANDGGMPTAQPGTARAVETLGQTSASARAAAVMEAAAATPVANWSRLTERLSHSEVRVAINSDDFGAISVDAVLRHDSLGTTLRVDHAELRTALAENLAELKSALQEHRLELSSFSVTADTGGASGQHGSSGYAGGRQRVNAEASATAAAATEQTAAAPVNMHQGRLNVHA